MKFFHTLAEGGQTWAHRVRMVKQVLKIAFNISLLSGVVYFIYALSKVDPLLVQSSFYRAKAELNSCLSLKNVSVNSKFWELIFHEKVNTKDKIVSTELLKRITENKTQVFLAQGKELIFRSLKIAFFFFSGMIIFFLIKGNSSKKKLHISGKRRKHWALLKFQLILQRKASTYKIASLPLVKGTETQHILITGGTGSGKTNCFHHLLPQIREKYLKAVVIDTTGIYINKYFDPNKDILLNPFDNRGSLWHPWIECENSFDYDNFAESIIPQTHHDQENYWRTAARSFFSAILQKLKNTQKTSELAHWLLYAPLDKLAEFLQDTKAAAHIDINSEKTAASIRSVAASFLSCLDYLPDASSVFSIKKWIQKDDPDSWLFLYAKPSQRSTLNPFLSCWFSIAVRSLIQMPPDLDRKIWFIIDELPVLQKIKELEMLVTEGRKYGGCGLLALQSPSQLEDIYGKPSSQTIIGNCATRIIFAEHDPEIATKISKSLGECEIKEYQEGISYGAHEIRDGVNLSYQTKKNPIVSSTEIQSLENNHAFIKLPGNLPITKLRLKLKK